MEKFLGMPPDAAVHGGEIDFLVGLVHWLMFALFAGWAVYFVVALIRFRASKNTAANYHGVKGHYSTYVEVAVIAVEAVLLVAFSIPIWAKRVDAFPAEERSTVVRIVAEQFAWNVHYPGPDGVFGRTALELVGTDNPLGLDRSDPAAKDDVTTINQFNVPVGKPVVIHLTSKDVIHSLNLPAFRVKQDAVPGLNIPVHFTPTKTTDEIRGEMTRQFDVEGTVAGQATLRLPVVETVALERDHAREGMILTTDVEDSEETTVMYAGDELSADNVNLMLESGITEVRARRKTDYDRYIAMADYSDAEGTSIVEKHESLDADIITALMQAGVTEIAARKRSNLDPWMVMETLNGPDGTPIVTTGDYLSEEQITAVAEMGGKTILVAPFTPTEIACAQLCGLGHYRMRGYMDVLTQEDFRAWMDEQVSTVRSLYGDPAESESDQLSDAAQEEESN
jgi:cytochrome c oxidase subunit 2